MDVTKMPVPEAYGAAPEYNPESNAKKFDRTKRPFNKAGGAKPSGNKPYKPRPKTN